MAQDARIASKKGARNAREGSQPVGGLERATTKKGLTVVVFAEEKKREPGQSKYLEGSAQGTDFQQNYCMHLKSFRWNY